MASLPLPAVESIANAATDILTVLRGLPEGDVKANVEADARRILAAVEALGALLKEAA